MYEYYLESIFDDLEETKKQNQEKVDYYYNLYFVTKKRKNLRRKAKTRMLKSIKEDWQFWTSIKKYTLNLFE